jgi:hypothetical protein
VVSNEGLILSIPTGLTPTLTTEMKLDPKVGFVNRDADMDVAAAIFRAAADRFFGKELKT